MSIIVQEHIAIRYWRIGSESRSLAAIVDTLARDHGVAFDGGARALLSKINDGPLQSSTKLVTLRAMNMPRMECGNRYLFPAGEFYEFAMERRFVPPTEKQGLVLLEQVLRRDIYLSRVTICHQPVYLRRSALERPRPYHLQFKRGDKGRRMTVARSDDQGAEDDRANFVCRLP